MQAYHLLHGVALVYIVPWAKDDETAGRRLLLGEVAEGRVIPAFSYRDMDYTHWRFSIVPKNGTLEFRILEDSCTAVLKEKFLSRMNIDTFQQEGYERGLLEFYSSETLKDDIYIQRGIKNEPKVSHESANVIQAALKNTDSALPAAGQSKLYRLVAQACRKGNIPIADEEHLIAACGQDFTVPDIARESNFICREVVLDADWYANDCGILIGTMDHEPVACVPKGRTGYQLYQSGSDKPVRIDRKTAGMIEPKAFSISRALEQHALTRKDIFRFCRGSVQFGDIFWIVLLGLTVNLIGILLPTLNQMIYDDYIPIGNFSMLMQTCSLIVCFMIGKLFFSLVKRLCEFRISSRVGLDLQNAMYYRIFQMPGSFFRNFDSADLAQRLMQFSPIANQITTTIVTSGFAAVFSLIYLVRMCTYSVKMSLIAILMVLILAAIVFALNAYALRYERNIADCEGVAASRIYQYLSAVEKIRLAGAEERAILEYLMPFAEKQQNHIKRNRIASVSSVLLDVSTYLFSMVLYLVIVKQNIGMSTGQFIAFNSAFGTFSASILELINGAVGIYSMRASFARLKPIIGAPTEDTKGKEIVSEINGSISLEHVTFSYHKDSRNILNDFSLEIKPGEYVAIVGPSGCGKSTLLKLLLGFETPKTGRVCYDGKDLATLNKHSLRKHLGVVLQNGRLIAGSIYENVTITANKPSMTEVNEVIEAVGLKDDIASMPMGIHTVLSESGGTISGGQQQRILIARSIMNRPKVLFFDEATSALDNLTQAKVCENLDRMNMTRIVIAHRLSTIKNCDRILVIKDGQLVEEGNYDSLMKQKNLFYQMACRQIVE